MHQMRNLQLSSQPNYNALQWAVEICESHLIAAKSCLNVVSIMRDSDAMSTLPGVLKGTHNMYAASKPKDAMSSAMPNVRRSSGLLAPLRRARRHSCAEKSHLH